MNDQNRKIKVVIVINNFLIGGVQKQLTLLLPLLDGQKFEFHLITLFESPNEKALYHKLPERLPVYKLKFKNFYDITSWIQLAKTISRIKPDIVVSSLFFSNTVIRVLKPFFGYKAIIREHNTYINKTRLKILVDRILSKLTYKIVAVSETVANFTSKQERIPISKFEVIYNGADTESLNEVLAKMPPQETIKKKLGFNPTDKLIINVARLAPQKNHKLLIESFAEFSEEHPDYKLVIIGDGSLKEELEELSKKLGKADKVFLLGAKENVVPYYAVSDFFVLTSDIEGFATVCIEAMACGLPVISTKTAGPDEYIVDGKNGFFVKFDVDDIVRTMNKIINLDMSDNAKETARKFDISNTVKNYEKLFIKK